MPTPGFQFSAKSPSDCSQRELAEFEKLVKQGGEVAGASLTDGILRAVALVFMTEGGTLQGIAGLKSPAASYRAKISARAGVALPSTTLPYELGWVYIVTDAQGKKQSRPLVQNAIAAANGRGMFATSRDGKDAMHHVLTTEGFVRSGKPYLAANGEDNINLFVRVPAGKPAAAVGDLMKDLREAMLEIYRRSLRDTGVDHRLFHQMIIERSPHETALHLVHALKPSDGYTDLFLKKRLDLTVEALVLQAKWTPIFADETRQQARKRLTEYHFDFAKYGLQLTKETQWTSETQRTSHL
jgi:predicted GNAT family N-acyltransferase